MPVNSVYMHNERLKYYLMDSLKYSVSCESMREMALEKKKHHDSTRSLKKCEILVK